MLDRRRTLDNSDWLGAGRGSSGAGTMARDLAWAEFLLKRVMWAECGYFSAFVRTSTTANAVATMADLTVLYVRQDGECFLHASIG